MEQINRQCEQAHIIMGASVDEELADRLSVTLLAANGVGPADWPSEPSRLAMRQAEAPAPVPTHALGLDAQSLNPCLSEKGASRFLPPPPPSSPERIEQLLVQQGAGVRARKGASRLRQGQLPLEIISKGRFEKSQPTIHQGQDLDVPTYIRRGVALN